MSKVRTAILPPGSLLAKHAGPDDYTDCFVRTVPGTVSLSEYITRFYSSWAFLPERKLLGLIGRGANHADIAALAEGGTESFAAWDVIARTETEYFARDFQGRTASWLKVEPSEDGASTKLYFGSLVVKPDSAVFKALMGFHVAYAKVLLGGV